MILNIKSFDDNFNYNLVFFYSSQIIRERIYPHKSIREGIVWNSHPGALLTRPGYSDSYQDFPWDFAPHSPVCMEKETSHLSDSSPLYYDTNSYQVNTHGREKRGCPPSVSGCEDKVDMQYNPLPPNSHVEEEDDDDYNRNINSQNMPQGDNLLLPLSPAKEHRRLLGILLPFGHPSRPDSKISPSYPSYSSLRSSFVRDRTSWNSTLNENSDSTSKFTAVIYTQLSAASPVVHYNAPLFKLVSNVAASEQVDKVWT